MSETIETCRLLYNDLLEDRIKFGSSCFAQKRAVTLARHENKFLKAVHSQVAQNVVLRLDMSYCRFFAGLSGRPRFKRKGKYNSFTFPQLGGFKVVDGRRLRLSKIGLVRVKQHRLVEGTPKTCTIVRDVDHWYACISADFLRRPERLGRDSETAVGVDLGVRFLVTLSDGRTFENPRLLVRSITRLKALQKRVSRKIPGSRNREKLRVLLAKAWRKVRNQRLDVAHKISFFLAKSYSTIAYEDLQIANMEKNHSLASAIMDASWARLRQLTAYKAERRGGRVLFVDPKGTSQKCSRCEAMVQKELSERVHRCPNCGLVMDRDVNAG